LLLGQFCALLDVSVTNVALPSIGRATGAGPSELQWIVSGYILAFALMPVIAGRLGDTRGRRRMFIIGLVGFIIASAAVGLSPVPLVMIAARVIQGLFGGLLGPQVSGYIQNAFPRSERGRAFSGLGITVGVGTALGPVIGGLLIGLGGPEFGWRLVFFINVPIGLVAIILAKLWVTELKPVESAADLKLDLAGAVLLGLTLLCILFPIVEINEFHNGWLFLLFVPGALFLWGFLRRESRLTREGGAPLLNLELFHVPTFTTGVFFAVVFFCSNTGIPLLLSLYYQDGLGFTALQSGLGVTAFALGSVLGATVAGRLVSRVGRPLVDRSRHPSRFGHDNAGRRDPAPGASDLRPRRRRRIDRHSEPDTHPDGCRSPKRRHRWRGTADRPTSRIRDRADSAGHAVLRHRCRLCVFEPGGHPRP
jgi:MFS family permease